MLIRDGGVGGGGGGGGRNERVKARPRGYRPKKTGETVDRRQRVLRRCPLAIARRLVYRAIAVSTAVLGQSHKDNVCCTAVEEQPEAKKIQLSQPSSTTLLMISFGLRVQLHLPPLDLAWNPVVMTHTVSVCVRHLLQVMLNVLGCRLKY